MVTYLYIYSIYMVDIYLPEIHILNNKLVKFALFIQKTIS